MTKRLLLSLPLALACALVRAAPLDRAAVTMESCQDALAMSAATEALSKINQNQEEGYVLRLHRLSNAHSAKHGESGIVFYLTLDVVETNCSVHSKKDWKDCEARPTAETPVYGQCKAAIYMNKVHSVLRLYKYECLVRPVPAERVHRLCPDCLTFSSADNAEIQKTVSESLKKFNNQSGLANQFAVLKITRAAAGMALGMYYHAEYSIQETTCPNSKDTGTDNKCPLMECEFSHKGFCKASHHHTPTGDGEFSVVCEIYEPEAAEREKKLHLLGDELDHSHNDSHAHDAADPANAHDHMHDHTKSHDQHVAAHAEHSDHHHTHDHPEGGTHRHAHDHAHDHGHGHDHVHAHHAEAHDHSGDRAHQHHDYKHGDGARSHQHDHELALDHEHKHAHVHAHEHHHHHHAHEHETTPHDHPRGAVRRLPALGRTTPAPPDVAAAQEGAAPPPLPDPQVPGEMQPSIGPFPASLSSRCAAPAVKGPTLVEELFDEDPVFKAAA